VGLRDAAERVRRGQEKAVVRPDQRPAVAAADRQRPTVAADARIDNGEVHALGHVRKRVPEDQRALEDLLRRHAVRDVDDLRGGGDALHHAVTGADEVVL
jgi:hypothetical protein